MTDSTFTAIADMLKPLSTQKELEAVINVKQGTLGSLRFSGTGPRFLKLGGNVLYPKETVIAYLQQCSDMPVDVPPVLTALADTLTPICLPGDLTQRCRFSQAYLRKVRRQLRPIKIGRAWKYSREQVIEFMRDHLYQSNSEYESKVTQ